MRRSRIWLAVAVVLLVLAAWLMSGAETKPRRTNTPEVSFPNHLRDEEWERLKRRRSLRTPIVVPPDSVAPKDADAEEHEPAPRRDPVLVALPSADKGKSTVVVEANALANSPIGALVLDCLDRADGGRTLAQYEEKAGFNPARDLDRVAVSDKLLLMSGHFAGITERMRALGTARAEPIGTNAVMFVSGESKEAVWKDEILLASSDEQEIRDAIGRLDGTLPSGEPAIPESETYGDVYGVLSVDDLAKLVPDSQAELRDRLRETISGATLHADASQDMAVVAELSGADTSRLGDLGAALGGALSLGRMAARTRGDDRVTEMLANARVVPGTDQIQLELALPLAFFERSLAECAARGAAPEQPEQLDAKAQ